ncbi:MAG: ABC transporter substrate-binding protein [Pseudomonadota bacterium]
MRSRVTLALAASGGLAFAGAAAAQDLLFLASDVPAGLNYDGPAAAIPTSQTGMVNVMEPLIDYAAAGTNDEGITTPEFGQFEGRLAESWSFDEASLTWTFNLRQGVTGCGGAEFTADDVLYTFERAKSVSGAAPIGWFLSNVGSIAGFTPDVFGEGADKSLGAEVAKIDDYTVTITQSEPNALFLPVLTIFGLYMFDKEGMEAQATEADPWSHDFTNNVGMASFGPYCVERWTKDDEIVLTANENYYRGAPAIKTVVMKRVPQSSNRVVILRTGQAQLVQGLTPREYDSLRDAAGIAVGGVAGNENLFVHMNFDTPPFDNPLVRQAIAHAIPTEQIIQNAYFGQATVWNGHVPSSYPGYHQPERQYPYDPEGAAALLAEAGYPGGAGLDAYADALQLSYVAEKETTLGPIVNAIATALRGLGMPVDLNPIPQTQYGDRQLVKRDLPFAVNDQEKPIGVDAGYASQLFFVSPESGGLNNMVNYRNPAFDGLWAEARVEADASVRDNLLAEMQDMLMEDVVWAPVVEYKTQWAFADGLKGLRWYPDNSVRFFDLSFE